MTSPDEEFDDFLRRRRPVFGRNDELEPPLELDRVVLRQAREAIEGERRPHKMFRTPSWGMPVALAATLVLAFTIILRVGPSGVEKKSDVTVRTVARQAGIPEAAVPAAPPAPAPAATRDKAETARVAEQRARRNDAAPAGANVASDVRAEPVAEAAPKPSYRRDTKSWLAEIERLRASGDNARADAELAEYKREHRAYAGAPDR